MQRGVLAVGEPDAAVAAPGGVVDADVVDGGEGAAVEGGQHHGRDVRARVHERQRRGQRVGAEVAEQHVRGVVRGSAVGHRESRIPFFGGDGVVVGWAQDGDVDRVLERDVV